MFEPLTLTASTDTTLEALVAGCDDTIYIAAGERLAVIAESELRRLRAIESAAKRVVALDGNYDLPEAMDELRTALGEQNE